MSEIRHFRARGVLRDDGRVLAGGAVGVAGGRVVEVREHAPAGATDLGDALLTPSLVNAHCHLELTGFAGKLPREGGFAEWVRALVALRAEATPAELEEGARQGARRLAETGCGLALDVDTTGAAARALATERLSAVVHREALDVGDRARRAEVLAALERPLELPPHVTEGLSPHAPYTCSPELLAGLADLARRRRLPLAIHWAESVEEVRYLRDGEGPLAAILGPSPRKSGLDLLEEAGLLASGLDLTLVHGNHPEPGDYERLAAAGVPLVHCPGTHGYFGRAPFDARAALDAGLELRLGTDGMASNDDLDLARELRRFAALPGVAPEEAWRAATARSTLLGAPRLCAWPADGAASPSLAAVLAEGRAPRLVDLAGDAPPPPSRYPVGDRSAFRGRPRTA